MPTFTYRHAEGPAQAVEDEDWCWVARYADGTHLAQFDARDGSFHRFDEIDLGRLVAFEVCPARGPVCVFSVRIRPGMRPIFFKRHQRLHVGTPQETHVVLFCFGYQETVGRRNVKTLMTIRPDGSIWIENTDGRP